MGWGVGVDYPKETDPGTGQVLEHRAAEASRADDEHATACQRRLALRADLLEQCLP